MCGFDSLNPRLKVCCVCVCVCACMCAHMRTRMLDAYSTITHLSDSQYWTGLCVSPAVWKVHFAVWTILVSLETMSIIFLLDASQECLS